MRRSCLFLFLAGCSAAPSEIRTEKTTDVQAVVIAHLKKTLNDTEGFEVVEWGEPERAMIYDGGDKDVEATEIAVKYRAKNRFGAKEIYFKRFYVRNGKIVSDAARPYKPEADKDEKPPIYAPPPKRPKGN